MDLMAHKFSGAICWFVSILRLQLATQITHEDYIKVPLKSVENNNSIPPEKKTKITNTW